MSKFVGKFRKQKDYSDDYDFARNHFHNKKRKNGENGEIKKIIRMCQDEDVYYDERRKYKKH